MSLDKIFGKYPPDKVYLIEILHEIQDRNPKRYITHEDIVNVSKYLNISISSVYGVITYYSMFSLTPRSANIIRVCQSPVCEMKGSSEIISILSSILGIALGETTPDGLFTLETSQCLGYCSSAPGFSINNIFYGDLDKEKISAIINSFKK